MASYSLYKKFIDHYKITGFFQKEKRGGQKMVYFVNRQGHQQVMKVYADGKDERFDREMEIYEKFKNSDGIPKIYEIDEYEGEAVVFEQYVDGDTLSDIAVHYSEDAPKIKLLLKSVITIMEPIWIDRKVHRDIKPENIMIRKDGSTVLLDFGIARDLGATSITSTGFQPGTYIWAAPEQIQGKKDMVSHKTDLFSLGVLAYYLFHQKMPFGSTYDEVRLKYESGDEACSIKAGCDLQKFLETCLRFSPNFRPRMISDYTVHL